MAEGVEAPLGKLTGNRCSTGLEDDTPQPPLFPCQQGHITKHMAPVKKKQAQTLIVNVFGLLIGRSSLFRVGEKFRSGPQVGRVAT